MNKNICECMKLSRSADYTIQGFLYQFNKALFELLNNDDDTVITLEGIEDIDVYSGSDCELIQCKYHESQETFNLSKIYKPVLLMLKCYYNESDKNKKYTLFCHFPNKQNDSLLLTKENIKTFLSSDNQKLEKLVDEILGYINNGNDSFIDEFIEKFHIEFGESFEELTKANIESLKANGFNDNDIKDFIYPNAVHQIATISCNHNINNRKISKIEFIDGLKKIKSTIISKWTKELTKELKTYKNILTTKRKQLRPKLKIPIRKRYFILDYDLIEDFENKTISFIKEILDKLQYKNNKLHLNKDNIPVFILKCTYDEFAIIAEGVKSKNIPVHLGFFLSKWCEEDFFKEPIIDLKCQKFEFRTRLMQIDETNIDEKFQSINKNTCDDLFIISNQDYEILHKAGIEVEKIETENLDEVKYVLSLVDDYE